MPALKPTQFAAEVIWLGRVVSGGEGIRSEVIEGAFASFDGFDGEVHGGATRPSCVRTKAQHPKGTTIRNVRQLSILSEEQVAQTAAEMGIAQIDPTWLGASLIVRGIPDFTHVPPSSRLQAPSGATLVIDMENRPCQFPAKEIEKEEAGFGKLYLPAARGRRGVTAWVEREGDIRIGDKMTLHVPDQPVWAHLEEARAE
ncbi:MAG: MOSC domain-containing protein [Rhodobacteraceae bacterium]|nr:MOSC domain-containing protein [Paracoccaceae bacterium]